MNSQGKDARAPEQGGVGLREWPDLYDATDRAAQALAVVASALESRGSPQLYRSALEAHAYASMLRAELRAELRALSAAADVPRPQTHACHDPDAERSPSKGGE